MSTTFTLDSPSPNRLSIVTICWNDLRGLQATIDSLRQQDTYDFEQIIVDGASSDGTADYLKSLSTPWKLTWVSEKDRGIYDAMNKGSMLAGGEYLWFLNSGDTAASSEVTARICAELRKRPGIDLLYGKAWLSTGYGLRPSGRQVTTQDFLTDMPVCHQSCVYRKSALDKPPYTLDFRLISDWILTQNLFSRGSKTLYIDFFISVYDLSGLSSSNHKVIVRERLRYERSFVNRTRILLKMGGKFALISILKKTGFYSIYKTHQHRRIASNK